MRRLICDIFKSWQTETIKKPGPRQSDNLILTYPHLLNQPQPTDGLCCVFLDESFTQLGLSFAHIKHGRKTR